MNRDKQYTSIIEQASIEHNPSVIAIYAFEVAKLFNSFYTEHSVMNAESDEKKKTTFENKPIDFECNCFRYAFTWNKSARKNVTQSSVGNQESVLYLYTLKR